MPQQTRLILLTAFFALVFYNCGGAIDSTTSPTPGESALPAGVASPSAEASPSLSPEEEAGAAICALPGQLGGIRSLWFDALRGAGATNASAAKVIEGLTPTVGAIGDQVISAADGPLADAAYSDDLITLGDLIRKYASLMATASAKLLEAGTEREFVAGKLDAVVAEIETAQGAASLLPAFEGCQ